MNRERKLPVRSQSISSKVNGGRAISYYREGSKCLHPGRIGGFRIRIQSGKVKKTVVSEQGKEAVGLPLDGPSLSRARDIEGQ